MERIRNLILAHPLTAVGASSLAGLIIGSLLG